MDTVTNQLKVVIVEDNVALAEIYKTRLELIGYEVHVANDGEQGLFLIQKELPKLVLLDLMVPKVAGDQILEKMRASDWGKDIKVLIISNLNEADAPAGLRDKGIEGYAVKANLTDDMLDKMVDAILKPSSQTEDVSLETPEPTLEHVPVQTEPQPAPVTPVTPDAPATPQPTVTPASPGGHTFLTPPPQATDSEDPAAPAQF